MPESKGSALRRVMPAIIAAAFLAAGGLLYRELSSYSLTEIADSVSAMPTRKLLYGLLLAASSYLCLTAYDALALSYLRRNLPYRRTALASFTGYVFSHNIGLSVLGGAAPRYRLYSAWGLSTLEIATLVTFSAVTLWLGPLLLTGGSLLFDPLSVAATLHLSAGTARWLGLGCILVVAGYLWLTAAGPSEITVREWSVRVPPLRMAALQIALSVLDWVLAAATLYSLLPDGMDLGPRQFVTLFIVAQAAGLASHVPGGFGVFETILLVSTRGHVSAPELIGSLLVYRAIYYVLPLVFGIGLLAGYEALQQRRRLTEFGAAFGQWVPEIAPRFLSLGIFLCGIVLIVSGAVPANETALAWVNLIVPLPLLELSHFLGSLVGVGLLLLASGLHRRLDAAYHLSVALLATGVLLSLVKGLHVGFALIQMLLLLSLFSCRRHFTRSAALLREPFTPGWAIAVTLVIGGVAWLTFFSQEYTEYSRDLWWQFSLEAQAPRSLRAAVGIVSGALVFAVLHLLRLKPLPLQPVLKANDRSIAPILASSPSAWSQLAFLDDKSFLLNEAGTALIMYGVSGRSFVCYRDPVGEPRETTELLWLFRGLCDRYGAWPVIYEASTSVVPVCFDIGLTALKFGEEARVDLRAFSLEGHEHKRHRQVLRVVEREDVAFEVVPPEQVPALLPQLSQVSDEWLRDKRTREKGFSLGRFDARYLSRCPMGLVRKDGSICGFVNLLCSGGQHEIAADLMRYSAQAPKSVMEYLLLRAVLWAKEQGYGWFNLGMAPLSGLDERGPDETEHKVNALWNRIGAMVFERGESLYNFQGLRQFKEKFDPVWEPRYLVCPPGLVLPRVLANVAALVSGGLAGVIVK